MKLLKAVLCSCALSVSCVCAQGIGSGSGKGAGTAGKLNAYGLSVAKTMVSGSVKTDDGAPLNGSVKIQMVCGATEMTVAQTNVLDDFAFLLRSTGDSGVPGSGVSFNALASASYDTAGARGALSLGSMGNCDLRADLAGYRSSSIHLSSSAFEAFNAGTIWLHRVGGAPTSNTVSIATLAAPKDAMKQFVKGQQLAGTSRLAQAAKCLRKAVELDAGFAEAWLYLGSVQYRMSAMADAEASLMRARDIDPKLSGVYLMLGYMAFDKRDWNATVRYMEQAEHINPLRSAQAWYVTAVANFELHRYDEAERNIRQEMKLDPQLQIPRANYLLGLVLIQKGNAWGGAKVLRDYLAAAPDPRDVESAKHILARAEVKP